MIQVLLNRSRKHGPLLLCSPKDTGKNLRYQRRHRRFHILLCLRLPPLFLEGLYWATGQQTIRLQDKLEGAERRERTGKRKGCNRCKACQGKRSPVEGGGDVR